MSKEVKGIWQVDIKSADGQVITHKLEDLLKMKHESTGGNLAILEMEVLLRFIPEDITNE